MDFPGIAPLLHKIGETLEHVALDIKVLKVYYENSRKASTWDKSKARTWLNNSFLDLAFSKSERDGILETEVSYTTLNNSNDVTCTFLCKDKVFLLSYSEVQKYFVTDETRKLNSTIYARNHGAHYPQCYWMTRSVGKKNDEIMAIKNGGQLGYSTAVDDQHLGVRPTMWLDLNTYAVQMAATHKGNIITFGNYGDKDNKTYAPLYWRIIASTGNSVTLLSERVIDNKQFNKDRKKIDWDDSELRTWLNSSFVDIAFNEFEKNSLLPITVRQEKKDGVDGYRSAGWTMITDNVTLLSYRQVKEIFPKKEDRRAVVTDHAKRNGAGNEFSEYWLLSPGKDDVSMAIINWGGDPDTRWVDNRKGVRPVIKVSLMFGLDDAYVVK